eukprot:CAMPEP_0117451628 /NCGR_PEP_ID=MMETSP0759-20121206/9115_1 /TAXON_ID=63605 /ORGANISM="Percolomonas cosmopolitus, Strain WS" /LENGTH=556 /DNA_ID=CAMNT_0005244253 /DNA_START=363 /DNA_END=2030 /DNA_ORIENTATION=-
MHTSSSPSKHSHSPLHRSYFSSDASLHTHYFHIKSATIPSHYLKARPCSSSLLFSSQALPPGVLILKRPETKNSPKKSRYKWFYERHSSLKCHNFDKCVLHEAEDRIILQKEEEAALGIASRRDEKSLHDVRRAITLSNDKSSRFLPRGPQMEKNDGTDSYDDHMSVWKFISCDESNNAVVSSHDHDPEQVNAPSTDEYYIQYYDGRYLSAKEGRERERLLVLTDDYSELSRWRVLFCERRRIGDDEAKLLQRLALKDQEHNPETYAAQNTCSEFRVLKQIEMDWFWDIAHKPVAELERKFDILNLMGLVDEFGFNCLMRAILRRRHDLVRYFLTRFPRDFVDKLAKHRNDTQQTCLHLAAYLGDVTTLRMLLDFGNIPTNSLDKHMHTPLMDAVERGNSLATVQMLCKTTDCIRTTSRIKQNIFHLAAMSGNPKIFDHLLSFDVRERLCLRKDSLGFTPLHIAAQFNHLPIVQILVQHQTEDSVNAQTTETRDTALHIVASNKNQHILDVISNSSVGESVDLSITNGSGVSVREALKANGLVLEKRRGMESAKSA